MTESNNQEDDCCTPTDRSGTPTFSAKTASAPTASGSSASGMHFLSFEPVRERPLIAPYDGRRTTITFLRVSLARAGGSVDELVAVLARDVSSPFCFCRIADDLEKAGREQEALTWLERGLAAFPPAGDPQLRSRASGLICETARTKTRPPSRSGPSTPNRRRAPNASSARQARSSANTQSCGRLRFSACAPRPTSEARDTRCVPNSTKATSRAPGETRKSTAARWSYGGGWLTPAARIIRTKRWRSTVGCSNARLNAVTSAPTRKPSTSWKPFATRSLRRAASPRVGTTASRPAPQTETDPHARRARLVRACLAE